MEEYNNEEFYENVYEVPEDDFNADAQMVEPSQEQNEDIESEIVQDEQNKEEDSKISIKDITELIKAINPEQTENKEEVPVEENPVEEKSVEEAPVEEVPVEKEKEEEIETHDYSEILNDIQREVSSGNADNQDAQQYIIDYIDNHSVNTPIDSISIDTLLLVLIFTALLTNILVNLIRRLF